jgi:tetratricopeptide (TPR) repeat protein
VRNQSPRAWLPLTLLALLLLPAVAARAENEGQAELDQATETKLTARSMQDLTKVVNLIEEAMDKGLDEENSLFAKQLLGATLQQRGTLVGNVAVGLGPRHPQFALLRAQALGDLKRSMEATAASEDAATPPETLLLVARLNMLPGGNVEAAKKAIEKGLAQPVDDARIRAEFLTLRAAISSDVKEKRRLLDEAVQSSPKSAAALRTRGLLLADQGHPEEALEDFNAAIRLDADHSATHEAKAIVLAQLKRYDEALKTLDQLAQLEPESVAPLLQKARIHLLQDDHQAALEELNMAGKLQPENLRILLLRAGVHDEAGDRALALDDVEQALKLKPDFPPAVRLKATLLADDEKFDEAIAELQRLSRAGSPDPLTLLQLGMLQSAAKQSAGAVETYRKVLADQPDNWLALRGLGDALLNLGRHKEAIAQYEKALKENPDEVGVLNNFAWVLATSPKDDLRDGDRAVELATKASKLTDDKEAHILSTVAAAYAETGDFEKALEWIEKALTLANQEQIEPLEKERESYRRKEPWRELLGE